MELDHIVMAMVEVMVMKLQDTEEDITPTQDMEETSEEATMEVHTELLDTMLEDTEVHMEVGSCTLTLVLFLLYINLVTLKNYSLCRTPRRPW